MEQLIQRIKNALAMGADLEQIHDAARRSNVSEETFYLAYKAAEMLLKHQIEEEARLKMRAPPFGRK